MGMNVHAQDSVWWACDGQGPWGSNANIRTTPEMDVGLRAGISMHRTQAVCLQKIEMLEGFAKAPQGWGSLGKHWGTLGMG